MRGEFGLLAAACLAAALTGCGGPFFVSESDLRAVLDTEHLYAGGSSGVCAFDVDAATGRIATLAGSPFGTGCTGALVAGAQGRALYAITLTSSNIYGFGIDPGGALSELPGFPFVPTDGPTVMYSARKAALTPNGRVLHILHSGTTEALTSYVVDPDTGALTFLGSTLGVGCGPTSMSIDSSGRNLYLGVGNSAIVHYPIDGGLPGARTVVATLPGVTVREMAVHPNGYLYAIWPHTLTQQISAYRIDPASGALTQLAGSPFSLGAVPTAVAGVSLAVDPTGERLYATTADDTLHSLRIDRSTGELAWLEALGTANYGTVRASNSGRYVFVGGDNHYGTGQIHVYQVSDDGTLSQIAGSPFSLGATSSVVRDLQAVRQVLLP